MATALLVLAPDGEAATLSNDPSAFADVSFPGTAPSVRFRSQNSGAELYIGSDLGSDENRTQVGFTYQESTSFGAVFDTVTRIVGASYGTGASGSRVVAAPAEDVNAI